MYGGDREMDDYSEISMPELVQYVSVCLDEMEKLNKKITELCDINKVLINENNTLVREHMRLKYYLDCAMDNIKYELSDTEHLPGIVIPKICDISFTIDMLVNKHCSMARYGDGEFATMSNHFRQKFQEPNEELARRLTEIIQADDENFLIAIADNYGNLEKYTAQAKEGIRRYMSEKTREEHMYFLDMERTYHNAYISRPYVLYKDNMTEAPKHRFDALKQIWNNRNVIIVEGILSRLGIGNDLFDGALSIKRIEAPATNAFDRYDEILETALKAAEDDTLFLIALGPTAGVLAYDLYRSGCQAIDIGQVDIEYEWFLKGEGERTPVRGKYNNEIEGGDIVENIANPVYESQIIAKIL
jgi:glycosyltransferase family protein